MSRTGNVSTATSAKVFERSGAMRDAYCALRATLNRRTLGLGAAQMLIEPRHDLDEIARPVTIVELVHQDVVPGIAAGARGTWQAEDVGRAGDARSGAGLDRRSTDLAVAHHQKQRRK